MVRVGGLNFRCAPKAAAGARIDQLTLPDGQPLNPSHLYKVAGWATVGAQSPGAPVWDVVADYLRAQDPVRIEQVNQPRLRGVENNPGLADYG